MQDIHRHIEPLSLEQIVRFAGAVQDFNPIHYDEDFARAAGLPGIVAQGPLTYLVTLDSLIAANGLSNVGGFQVRLRAPVMAGMSLLLSCDAEGKVSLKADGHEALVGTLKSAKEAAQ